MSQELSILGATLGSLSEDPSKANDGEQKDMETVMIETPKEGDNGEKEGRTTTDTPP